MSTSEEDVSNSSESGSDDSFIDDGSSEEESEQGSSDGSDGVPIRVSKVKKKTRTRIIDSDEAEEDEREDLNNSQKSSGDVTQNRTGESSRIMESDASAGQSMIVASNSKKGKSKKKVIDSDEEEESAIFEDSNPIKTRTGRNVLDSDEEETEMFASSSSMNTSSPINASSKKPVDSEGEETQMLSGNSNVNDCSDGAVIEDSTEIKNNQESVSSKSVNHSKSVNKSNSSGKGKPEYFQSHESQEEDDSEASLHTIEDKESPIKEPTSPFNPRTTHRSTAFGDLRNFGTPQRKPPLVVDFHTPRGQPKSPDQSRSPSPSSSVEIIEASEEEIIISDDDQAVGPSNKENHMPFVVKVEKPSKVSVNRAEYQVQKEKVSKMMADVLRNKNVLKTLNLNSLPDNGQLLKHRQANLEKMLAEAEDELKNMVVDKPEPAPIQTMAKPSSWQELDKFSGAVQPRTFGKQAMATYNQQKALTMDRLKQLHGSLKNCPSEDNFEEDPRGLLVELMPHQKHALGWLMWRERQKPSGGILADDMGLGKTLTMISLMLKFMQTNKENEADDEGDAENGEEHDDEEEDEGSRKKYKYDGGTLIVCPASLIGQWAGEVEKRLKRALLSVERYHGANREKKAKTLSQYDMVITTYSIVMNEAEKQTPLNRIKWRRIILDEAHQIRNHKSQTSMAVCKLGAKSRWALTGTPIHNKELDLYSLLKFIRVSPFDDFVVFKRWVSDKNAGGQERLNTVMSSLMLRRTKAQLQTKGSLKCLPERQWDLIKITLDKEEMDVYQKVLIFSRTLFSQFLHQRAEKDQNFAAENPTFTTKHDPNGEYSKMHRKLLQMNRVKEVKQHEILVLLLRLRQICCHPSLINDMLNSTEMDVGDDVNDNEELAINILDQLNKLNLNDDDKEDYNPAQGISNEGVTLREATRGVLNPNHPIFTKTRRSSKLQKVINILKENVLDNDDKAIIVSQWTGLLNLLATHLSEEGISYDQLDGKIPVHKRPAIIDNINNPKSKTKVLLLSLTAGGVGLNLVGANHLFLLDLHWNPQLEMQAQDRIYRVGQKKTVHVYKFMTADTIEERIKKLQDHKMNIAEAMLTGAKIQQSKLSLDDLKMLFNM
ncbi:PREDICTED: transcription termination factor 2 [Nicrophorus vespilloides]|uniref:Transcription termination factor 2 n=1 Tax=Nicrophorus vespilloides TaxID=110193 RepID=A0ABM1MUW5_NICVS|nr:PREDICTED: transcription termination factor 2 [Nicrophorus vespilloides]